MSCLIVSPGTIDAALTILRAGENGYLIDKLRAADVPAPPDHLRGEFGAEADAAWSDFGAWMLAVNTAAFVLCYPRKVDAGYLQAIVPAYAFQWSPCSRAASLAALRDWLYQCNEGWLAETKQLDAFNRVAGLIALELVYDLPAYQHAVYQRTRGR